jgi:hypothetical protein
VQLRGRIYARVGEAQGAGPKIASESPNLGSPKIFPYLLRFASGCLPFDAVATAAQSQALFGKKRKIDRRGR